MTKFVTKFDSLGFNEGVAGSPGGTPNAGPCHDSAAHDAPPGGVVPGLEVSRGNVLQNQLLQTQLADQTLQLLQATQLPWPSLWSFRGEREITIPTQKNLAFLNGFLEKYGDDDLDYEGQSIDSFVEQVVRPLAERYAAEEQAGAVGVA